MTPNSNRKGSETKSIKLLSLMDLLRRNRNPVTASRIADELGVSERTVYRDILSLQSLGASIDGEAGIGYLLRLGFFLPPLALSHEELEALMLGMRWVESQPDSALSSAAKRLQGKIADAAPKDLRDKLNDVGLWPVLTKHNWEPLPSLGSIRWSMQKQLSLKLRYSDSSGLERIRDVWPIHIFFYEGKQIVVAWCCLRSAFRHFRSDRILEANSTNQPYGTPRRSLARAWRQEWQREHPSTTSASGWP